MNSEPAASKGAQHAAAKWLVPAKSKYDFDSWNTSQMEFPVEVRHRAAIPESSRFRQFWSILLVFLLLYVGTLLPYFVAFYQLRIGEEREDEAVQVSFWVVDACFYLDLALNFFFTYEDSSGQEIFDLRKIGKRYLRGRFCLDVIACMPAEFWTVLLTAISAEGAASNGGMYKLTRLARLQRASRLTRMASLSRIVERWSNSFALLAMLKNVTFVRIVNFIFMLFWFVHILACGWYMCAALHLDPQQTWVARREIDYEETPLLEGSPQVQWVNSMYFVLTVFTTVGFGDIGAVTTGEIIYVSFTMLVGAVVHSIIVSEMIGVVTAMDVEQQEASRRMRLVDDFGATVDLDDTAREGIRTWLRKQAQRGDFGNTFDTNLARTIFLDGAMPSELLHDLPHQVFGGRLLENRWIKVLRICQQIIPPRLVISLALSLNRRQCSFRETVYQAGERPSALYLVDSGLFAFITKMPRKSAPQKESAPEPEASADGTFVLPGEVPQAVSTSWIRGIGNSGVNFLRTSHLEVCQPDASDSVQHAPYKIFPKGSYFGDVGLFDKTPRRDTARCESQPGALFILSGPDFSSMLDMWPQFRRVWQAEAARRARAHAMALRRRTAGDMETVAARAIQDFWRERKAQRMAAGSMQGSSSALRKQADVKGALAASPASPASPAAVLQRATFPTSPTGGNRPLAGCASLGTSSQGEAMEALRKEMRESIGELRTEILQEIRQGFQQLRNGQSSEEIVEGFSISGHFV